jgi:uncharacterized membrane protein
MNLTPPNLQWMLFRRELRAPVFALACASALAVGLVALRTVLTWRGQHLYLVWNLFLAWVPLLLALRIEQLEQRTETKKWCLWLTAIIWLLFFPNAPYIFTDLTHLKFATRLRWWTDLMMILLFAVTGLVLAFLSLHRMQLVVARRRGWCAGWLFVFGVAFLSGFGVYLGRFERWNSWDVMTNPFGLAADSFNWLHSNAAKFTVLFGMFLFTAYALLYSLTHLGTSARLPAFGPVKATTEPQ